MINVNKIDYENRSFTLPLSRLDNYGNISSYEAADKEDVVELLRMTLSNMQVEGTPRERFKQLCILEDWDTKQAGKMEERRKVMYLYFPCLKNKNYAIIRRNEVVDKVYFDMFENMLAKYDMDKLYFFKEKSELWLIYPELTKDNIFEIKNYLYDIKDKYRLELILFVLEENQIDVQSMPQCSVAIERNVGK